MKDPVTDELTLEGGALVLADQGVCCIDEFDKMLDADRTAIHEVMEQQTVSIAKAGINTILNARVSILAAANPSYGRYNIYRSITDNLKLPPALLSRFDLLWLLKDNSNQENDLQLASHVTQIHTNPDKLPDHGDVIDMKTMRRYIALCKLKNPHILPSQEDRLVRIFLDIRRKKRPADSSLRDDALFTSPRSLLAITRLATAFARLRLADHVETQDIDGAVGLYENSRKSVEGFISAQVVIEGDVLTAIYNLTEHGDKMIEFEQLADELAEKKIKDEDLMLILDKMSGRSNIDWDREKQTIFYAA